MSLRESLSTLSTMTSVPLPLLTQLTDLLTPISTPTAIDVRSDTVSWPPAEMRAAMAAATVGDDVYEEDPTVQALEALTARLAGMPAAILVSSGTQGNLLSMLAHAGRGSEVILGDKAHIMLYEAGGMAALGGLFPRVVPVQRDGTLRLADVDAAVRADDVHYPRSRLVCVENTQGTLGGVPLPPSYMDDLGALARTHGLKVHVDGARLFNAAAAYSVPISDLLRSADSASLCLSKGLCAPYGSMVVGSESFIKEVRRLRKQVGGGTRQAGVLAAAGIISLTGIAPLFPRYHDLAQELAKGLATLSPRVTVVSAHTNMVFFTTTIANLSEILKKRNILYDEGATNRMVIHYWITLEHIRHIVDVIKCS